MANFWEGYVNIWEDYKRAIQDANTWYEKILAFVMGDHTVWDFLEALAASMPFISPAAAGVKATAKYGSKMGLSVERFLMKEGTQIEPAIAKVASFFKTATARNSFTVVSAIVKTVRRAIPYTIADVVGEISGKAAFQLAKKAIQDLISSTLTPALTKLTGLKLTLLEFIEAIETVMLRLKIWQSAITKTLTELGALNLGKLGALVVALQAQIDKYVIKELLALRADLTALKLWTETRINALEVKTSQLAVRLTGEISAKLTNLLAEFNLFRLQAQSRLAALEAKALQENALNVVQNAEISNLKMQVKAMPETIAKQTDIKINDSWNDKLPEPTDKEIDDIADNAALMLGWLPGEIMKVYAPLLPDILQTIGKEFNVYGEHIF
jgi:hypothetical protein